MRLEVRCAMLSRLDSYHEILHRLDFEFDGIVHCLHLRNRQLCWLLLEFHLRRVRGWLKVFGLVVSRDVIIVIPGVERESGR